MNNYKNLKINMTLEIIAKLLLNKDNTAFEISLFQIQGYDNGEIGGVISPSNTHGLLNILVIGKIR